MKRFVGLFAILVLFISCNDDPTSVGSQILPFGDFLDFQVVDSSTDSLEQSSSYTLDDIDLKRSSIIMVGKNANLESWMLMRFYMLIPDSIMAPLLVDSLNIISTQIRLKPKYIMGDETGTFDFTVHRVYDPWTPAGFNKDSMSSLIYEPANYAYNKSITDTMITFDFESSLVLDWIKRTYDETMPENHGIVFMPTPDTERIFGFPGYDAYSQEYLPRLYIIAERPGVFIDTVISIPFSDVHAVKGEMPTGNPENIILQGGLTTRGNLNFDVSLIPIHSIINRATLRLYVDTLESVNGSIPSDSIGVTIFKDSELKTLQDSTLFQYCFRDSGTAYYEGEVTKLVQGWINGGDNQGFRLNLSDEARSVNKISIKGSNTSDPALKPRLQIIYSKKM